MKLSAKLQLAQCQGRSSCHRALGVQMADPGGCGRLAARWAQLPPRGCVAAPVPAVGAVGRGTPRGAAALRTGFAPGPAALRHRGSLRWRGRREYRVCRWRPVGTLSSCSVRTWAQRETSVAAFR